MWEQNAAAAPRGTGPSSSRERGWAGGRSAEQAGREAGVGGPRGWLEAGERRPACRAVSDGDSGGRKLPPGLAGECSCGSGLAGRCRDRRSSPGGAPLPGEDPCGARLWALPSTILSWQEAGASATVSLGPRNETPAPPHVVRRRSLAGWGRRSAGSQRQPSCPAGKAAVFPRDGLGCSGDGGGVWKEGGERRTTCIHPGRSAQEVRHRAVSLSLSLCSCRGPASGQPGVQDQAPGACK